MFPLPAALAARLQWAAGELAKCGVAERQMQAFVARAARWQRRWLLWVSLFTALLAVPAIVYVVNAWTYRTETGGWLGRIGFGLSALMSALGLFACSVVVVPRLFDTALAGWQALPLPGSGDLACRVCGAPLPHLSSPVLRCNHCAADNLAPRGVLKHLAATALRARGMVLHFDQRQRQRHSRARVALAMYPFLGLLGWLVGAVLVDFVMQPIARRVELPPDSERNFAVVRVQFADTKAPRACLAFIDRQNGKLVLRFGDRIQRPIAAAELAVHSLGGPVPAGWLVGRKIQFDRLMTGGLSGTVETVFRPISRPYAHTARVGKLSVYLPTGDLGGERVCLAEDPPGTAVVKTLRVP